MPAKIKHSPSKINATEIAVNYAKSVANGIIAAGKLQQLGANRFLSDLAHGQERGLKFDQQAAQRVINFLCRLQHVDGVWDNPYFTPAPWQTFVIANLFGWKKANGYRRFRDAYIEVARKNGKTFCLAGLGLYMLVSDDEPGARVVSAATKIEQAKEIFNVAAKMVKKDPWLNAKVQSSGGKIMPNTLYVTETGSNFKPLPYESGSGDGKNLSCALLDELHEHPDDGQFNLLKQALLARKQGMLIAITTAGRDNNSICRNVRERHEKILSGGIPLNECDDTFSFICCADTEDDKGEEWQKANPSMGVTFPVEHLQNEVNTAKYQPSYLNEFKRKHLCLWVSATTRAIDGAKWAACNAAGASANPVILRQVGISELQVCAVHGGLDLARKDDLAAFALVGAPRSSNDPWRIWPVFWMPEGCVAEKAMKDRNTPYEDWIRAGFIETTPGEVIDYAFIRQRINGLRNDLKIREIAYDPFYANQLSIELQHDGIVVKPCPQNMRNLTEPTKEFLARIPAKKIEHYGNPVLSWMASNLETISDTKGGIMPCKGKANLKIDGIVAAIMGMWSAMQNPDLKSGWNDYYEKNGISFI